MEALKRFSLALAVAAMGAACGGDDGDKPTPSGVIDGGVDAGHMDSGTGATGLYLPDGGTPPCNSATRPTAEKCGGSECEYTLAQLKSTQIASTTGACVGEAEIASFCSLTPVAAVTTCTVGAVVSGGTPADATFKTGITTCSQKQLAGSISDACLSCFVDSGVCAAQYCRSECLDPTAAACDPCRIKNHCISSFYSCAGIVDPTAQLVIK